MDVFCMTVFRNRTRQEFSESTAKPGTQIKREPHMNDKREHTQLNAKLIQHITNRSAYMFHGQRPPLAISWYTMSLLQVEFSIRLKENQSVL